LDVPQTVAGLVDAWCERRCLKALRWILTGWPMASGLTDDWAALQDALNAARAYAHDELTPDEEASLDELVRAVDELVHRLL